MRSHLESIPIELKTLSPLHIGCGKSITKKEYIYLENGQRVLIPDINKLFNYLVKNNFVKDFENYMLGAQQDLYKWLTGLNITKEEIESIKSYEVNASDAIIPQKPLKEINLIIKDNYKKPYIPGSSLKGYIKTAMLSKFISEDKKFAQYMFTKLKRKVENRNHNFKDEEREMDSYFLNKISTGEIKGKNSSVNSLMKGIQISDSEPIEVENVISIFHLSFKLCKHVLCKFFIFTDKL
jgi:CRISPR-associated protein Csm5